MIKRIIVIIGLIIAWLIWLLNTTSGLRLIFIMITPFIPGQFNYTLISGNILSGLQMNNVVFKNDQLQFAAKNLQTDWTIHFWNPKKLMINKVTGLKIEINFLNKQPEPTNKSYSQMGLLSYIDLQTMMLKDITIQAPSKPIFYVETFSLQDKPDGFYHFDLNATWGKMSGKYNLTMAPILSWQLMLHISKLNLKSLQKNLESELFINIYSHGIWSNEKKSLYFNFDQVHGYLAHLPIKGQGTIRYQNNQWNIQPSEIRVGNNLAQVKGAIANEWDLTWQLSIPKLETFLLDTKGLIKSSGTIKGPKNHLAMHGKLDAENLNASNIYLAKLSGEINSIINEARFHAKLKANDVKIDDYRIPTISAQLSTHWLNEQIASQLTIFLNQHNQINADWKFLAVKNLIKDSQPISGQVHFNFANLNDMVRSPSLEHIQGKLQGDATLSGYLNHPKIILDAHLLNGSVYIPKLNINLNDVNADLDQPLETPLIVRGRLTSGQGHAIYEAKIDFKNPNLPFTMTFKGSALNVLRLPEYKINASPDLSIGYNQDGFFVQGLLDIPYARIVTKDLSGTTTLPREVKFVNEQHKEMGYPDLNLDLRVRLGDHVYVAYQNLKTSLKGQLHLKQQKGTPPIAIGELFAINGKYYAYGRLLDIKSGRIFYTGNTLFNPGLDIRAVKDIETVNFAESIQQFKGTDNNLLQPVYQGTQKLTVGIDIKGTFNNPNIIFFSEPTALNKEDILSYLIFGYPRSKIRDMNKLALLSNMLSFNNDSANLTQKVSDKVQKLFGLTDLSVGQIELYNPENNKTDTTTTINISKQLGKKFTIQYRYGIFNSASILNLKYRINKRLAIQTETNNVDTGADLLFEYETD